MGGESLVDVDENDVRRCRADARRVALPGVCRG